MSIIDIKNFGKLIMIPINPKTKALIFDCDGTIADTNMIHNYAWDVITKKYNLNLSSQTLNQYSGLPTLQILKIINDNKNLNLQQIVHEKENIAEKIMKSITPIKQIIKIIKNYYKILPMVVISGGIRKNIDKTLKMLDVYEKFKFIITAEDDHPHKNNPKSFILIAKRLNISPNKCHVFEDGSLGLISAIKAGMMVTDVKTIYP